MVRRLALLATMWLVVLPAPARMAAQPVAQAVQAPLGAALPRPAIVRVSLTTSAGPIVLELEAGRAPVTTANFLRYVDQKRFDGVAIYRALKSGPGLGLIQGGVRNDPKRVLPPIAHEPTTKTGLSHVEGTISMARYAPGSANGDFFIIVGAMPGLDAHPDRPGDNLGFAAFGHVVEGMETARRILDSPVSPTEGEGAMKGQFLAPPVRIITARRVK